MHRVMFSSQASQTPLIASHVRSDDAASVAGV
jgi:hypothetical protein